MILLTGGAGFIGSHTAVRLLSEGLKIVIIDNFSNSHPEVLNRIKTITGRDFDFFCGDVCDPLLLRQIFKMYDITDVIHFAGLKAVSQSVSLPLEYYDVNLNATIKLLKVMDEFGVRSIVFSSSATVYGDSGSVPFKEDLERGCSTNPYGTSKSFNEQILFDLASSNGDWCISILRYFNPVGAHPSGLIGENPKDIPNNLMPLLIEAAAGKRELLTVFGDDYATPDGTGVRDFIHVVDLAEGHLRSLMKGRTNYGCHIYNLGTGKGYSVLQFIQQFERSTGQKVPYVIGSRRAGDVGLSYADVSKAKTVLNWHSELDLNDMCSDAWRWYCKNPMGYKR